VQVFALEHLGGCYQYQIIQTMGIYRLRKTLGQSALFIRMQCSYLTMEILM
jgi:hypothetical protein